MEKRCLYTHWNLLLGLVCLIFSGAVVFLFIIVYLFFCICCCRCLNHSSRSRCRGSVGLWVGGGSVEWLVTVGVGAVPEMSCVPPPRGQDVG